MSANPTAPDRELVGSSLQATSQKVVYAWDLYSNRPQPGDWESEHDWATLKAFIEDLRGACGAPPAPSRYDIVGKYARPLDNGS